MPDDLEQRFPRTERPDARAGAIDITAAPSPSVVDDDQHRAALDALREAALRAAGVIPHPSFPKGQQPRFWLRPSDQQVVAGLLVVALLLMIAYWVRLTRNGRAPVEIERMPAAEYLYRIDINRASWVEWAQFDGIGETLARRIVDDRDERGPFASVDDLLRVRGIGRTKLDAMRPHLFIEATNGREATIDRSKTSLDPGLPEKSDAPTP